MASSPVKKDELLRQEHQQLLYGLKTTVERLLASHTTNDVWATYGGLPRLCGHVENVLKHGLKQPEAIFSVSNDRYWMFIKGLRWFNPVMAPMLDQIVKQALQEGISPGKMWIRQSLEDYTLSSQLKSLVDNKEHLYQCYDESLAFLCNEEFFAALLICLQAVEQNNPALLANLDPKLLRTRKIQHTRSTSLPVNNLSRSDNVATFKHITEPTLLQRAQQESNPLKPVDETILPSLEVPRDNNLQNADISGDKSDPLMNKRVEEVQNVADSGPKVYGATGHLLSQKKSITFSENIYQAKEPDSALLTTAASRSDHCGADSSHRTNETAEGKNKFRRAQSQQNNLKDMPAGIPISQGLSSSLPDSVLTNRGLPDDLMRVSPPTECFFPRPVEGQSLMSFLSSQDFNTWPELDRENAHFSISEAIIAAVEQMKCNHARKLSSISDNELDASDEEIQELKQRIRLRRRERWKEKARMIPAFSDTNTTSSCSPMESNSGSDLEGSSASDVDDLQLNEDTQSNLTAVENRGLTASLASLYSDADLQKSPTTTERSYPTSLSENTSTSADNVAISLLKKFSAKHHPRASDLDWLVSENDAPQTLLPLPKSLPISPDDGENADLKLPSHKMRIRGNLEWAPPRPQIIFNIHPVPKRKVIVAKQNYRCAGCGMKIEPGYLKRLRYCNYLGKYFCHCCHGNSLSVIPGRILHRWDFGRYPVSNFSRDLLTKIINDPLFNVSDINSSLHRRIKALDQVKELRTQLFYLKDFLRTCRQGERLWILLDSLSHHLVHEPSLYSINDLLQVRSGQMKTVLKTHVEEATAHVARCQLCQAKGFICELCENDEILFPFQLNKCVQCPDCWACYHPTCFLVSVPCPKCERIKTRKRQRELENSRYSLSEDYEQGDKC